MRTREEVYDIHRETKQLLQQVDEQLKTITPEEEDKAIYLAARLVQYLKVVDDVIRDEYHSTKERNSKTLLDAVNIARRIIETKVKLDIDVTKLTLEKSVQEEFIRTVLRCIEEEAPELKTKIISRLKSKFAISYAMGQEINE